MAILSVARLVLNTPNAARSVPVAVMTIAETPMAWIGEASGPPFGSVPTID